MMILEVILTIIAAFRGFKFYSLVPILIALGLGLGVGFNLGGSEYIQVISLSLDVLCIATLSLMIAFKKEKFCQVFGLSEEASSETK